MSRRGFGTGAVETMRGPGGATTYRVKWKDAAGRRCQKVVASDRRTAERVLGQLVLEREQQLAGLKPDNFGDLRFDVLQTKYLAHLATTVKPRQVVCVKAHLERLKKVFANPRVRDLRKDQLSDYRQRRLAAGRANATVNLECGSLRAMLNYGVRMDLIPRNPLAGFAPLPMGRAHEKKPRRPLTEAELDAVLKAAESIDDERRAHAAAETTIEHGTKSRAWNEAPRPIAIPQTPFLRALAFTGARFSELASTTWGDWDQKSRMLTLRAETTKSKMSRRIPLLAAVENDLRRLQALHAEGYGRVPLAAEPIFLSPEGYPVLGRRENVRRFLLEALARADIRKDDAVRGRLCLHSMRHTFASMLARANAGLTQAQALLGHSDPKLTAAIYTHHEDGDLRAAVDKLRIA